MKTPLAIAIINEQHGALVVHHAEQLRARRFDAIVWMRTPTREEYMIVAPTIAAFPLIRQFTASETDVLLIKP